jgi:hypothetical protein
MSRAQGLELASVTLLVAALAAAIPLSTGYIAWSWDALNHHVYLGMVAEHSRWHLDVNAASFQSYQYPYLYWPVYRLSLMSGSGAWWGAAWSAFQAVLLVVPVWWISLRLLPEAGVNPWPAVAQRVAACAFAMMNAVILIGLETTGNDVLAAVPLLWGVYVGLDRRATDHQAALAAALLGVSVAFKLSNGLFLPLLLFWWWQPCSPHLPWRRGMALAIGACTGFVVPYAPWGWQLWRLTGNPFYPLLGTIFPGA